MRKDRKAEVNVTELRQNLPAYLAEVQRGKEIAVTSRGRVIARIVPGGDPHREAQERLLAIRKHCYVGDVLSPTGAQWEAERSPDRW
ncbi:MAG: type II toxin-antitoxin system prevent-host-death family antitoxin [Betaproteobacteria bacterium]|nr:type II toxin-antitoxin system prevent-host-death family antitoxin [Betaproteobacteria bacterium]